MRVIHVLKRIETLEEDIRELKKMEKLLMKNKSFTTPIYMSIEKQINILLGEKIKMLELNIENPPASITGDTGEDRAVAPVIAVKPEKPAPGKKARSKKGKNKKEAPPMEDVVEDDDDDIHLLTQDQIDIKIKTIEEKSRHKKDDDRKKSGDEGDDIKKEGDDHVKLLDIALEKGSLSKSDIELEKKKVRFFKDNFPGKEY